MGPTRLAARRLVAYGIDWTLFAAWGSTVFAVAYSARDDSGDFTWPTEAWAGQALGFVLTTLPFGLYFALTESSRAGASVGKRLLGLRVETGSGAAVSLGRAFARTAGKLVPWELGHTAAHQLLAHGRVDEEPPRWALWLATAAMALAAGYVATLFGAEGRTPYDRVAGTRVVGRPRASGDVTTERAQ
ncbi:MAG: RDD family protein [Planctomycetota bacterium]